MQRVIERLLNLLAFLLSADRPVTADEIRFTVAGYGQEGDEAFRRTFERDKDLLRQLGIPLRLAPTDIWEVEHGYVVRTEEYALPDPGLTDEELAALWLAAQLVNAGSAVPDRAALLKLGGLPPAFADASLGAELGEFSQDLGALFSAVAERRIASFTYHGRPRRVRPYGLVHRRGHWYLVARQAGESAPRSFRVDRLSDLQVGSRAGAFIRPPGFRAADAVPSAPWEAGDSTIEATVRFEPRLAWWARRQLPAAATVLADDQQGLVARLGVAAVEPFIAWMIGFEDEAEVVSPPELRAALLAHLEEP
ncbi:MAG: WYL domain-containing protein [Actinobacteria bacterium]|nr:WYL domain-containing protein [Actinomycetota bacterium]